MLKPALKIMSISMVDPTSRYKAYAVLSDDDRLIITDIMPISGSFSDFSGPLIDEIRTKSAAGYAVVIEDATERLSIHAAQYLFEDVDPYTGRLNIQDALDRYFGMMATDAIVFHPDCRQFMLMPGVEGGRVEKLQDERGKTSYRVDWNRFNGGHRAMLLCVVAACMEPMSDRYLQAMYPMEDEEDGWVDPLKSWRAITVDYDRKKYMEIAAKEDAILNELRRKMEAS